jgi:hypothetical protein
MTLDASTEKAACIIQIPKTGTLNTVELLFRAVSMNAASVLRVSFQDLDASGDPDGTQDQFRDLTTDPTANTWYSTVGLITSDGTDTGVKRAVTAGDLLAVVIEYSTFTAADSVIVGGITGVGNTAPAGVLPHTDLFTGTWAKSDVAPCLALVYSDSSYAVPDGCVPANATNVTLINTGSTPDERGLLFQLPFPARCYGFVVRLDLDAATDVVLYSAADAVLASYSLSSGVRVGTAGQITRRRFATPVSLSANTSYRLVVKPTTGSNVGVYDWEAASATLCQQYCGGSTWKHTERTDAGAWTDTDTKRPFLSLRLDQLDDGAGAGGMLVHPGMSGGMRA